MKLAIIIIIEVIIIAIYESYVYSRLNNEYGNFTNISQYNQNNESIFNTYYNGKFKCNKINI